MSIKQRVLRPSTIMILIGVLMIGGSKLLQPNKVTVNHEITSSGEAIKRAPTMAYLLSRAKELGLSGKQVEKLESLELEESVALQPAKAAVQSLLHQFNETADQSGHMPMATVQSIAAAVKEPSRRIRMITAAYNARGLDLLNPSQREVARVIFSRENLSIVKQVRGGAQ